MAKYNFVLEVTFNYSFKPTSEYASLYSADS